MITEIELAKTIREAVGYYSFSPKKVAAQVPLMHPTDQQSVYRLCRAIIEVMGAEDYPTDLRNQASHDEAKAILTYLKEHGRHIPMI